MLLVPVLLCGLIFSVNAQPVQTKAPFIGKHLNAPFLSPHFDTATRQIIWSMSTQYEYRDQARKVTLPNPVRNITNGPAGANYHLVKDINTATNSDPGNYNFTANPQFAIINNASYFNADDGIHGSELWRSDGTEAGTYLVKDINSGPSSSAPWQIISSNGKLYFNAYTDNEGSELWISDGTESGTHLLKDILPGVNSSTPYNIFSAGNQVYFSVGGINNKFSQLWKTDGTTEGTVLVEDLFIGVDNYSYNIFQLTSVNSLLYFTAYSGTAGRELWRSDGTSEGTYMVKDINSSNSGDYDGPSSLTSFDNHLYFTANDGSGCKLWITDGTYAGTKPVPGDNGITFSTGYSPIINEAFPIIGTAMYMPAFVLATGYELYKYDPGNTAGIVLVKDMNPGNADTYIDPYNMVAVNDKLFFSTTNTDNTHSLWASKGKANNTQIVQNFGSDTYLFDFVNGFGTLFFSKYDTTYGYELWKSDATAAGTSMVKDINPGNYSSDPGYITPLNQQIIFAASSLAKGAELWHTNGKEKSTQLIKDINQTATTGSAIYLDDAVAMPAGILFTAIAPKYGKELYRSDGTSQGTAIVADLSGGENATYFRNGIVKGDTAWFVVQSFAANNVTQAIYKTNGNQLIKVAAAAVSNSEISSIAVADNGLVFYSVYNYEAASRELWRTDGTPAGTFLLLSNSNANSASYLVTAGNTVFFSYEDSHGNELWKSDGTFEGTKMVKDINPGYYASSPYSLFVFTGNVYFGANDGTGSNSFWKSDGTAAGTVKLASVEPYAAHSAYDIAHYFCIAGNTLYFNGFTDDIGSELWKTNGTPNGTKLVKDIYPGGFGSSPNNFVNVNGNVFFAAFDDTHGRELWASKGGPNNTALVADITPGIEGSSLDAMASAAGKCFFTMNGKLWSSAGAASNTSAVADAAKISDVFTMIASGNKIFFDGYEYATGNELYEGDASVSLGVHNTEAEAVSIVIESEFNAAIVPNPTSDNAILKLSGNIRNAKISVADINGRTVWIGAIQNAKETNIPVSKLAAGIYIVTITENGKTKVLKMIKR